MKSGYFLNRFSPQGYLGLHLTIGVLLLIGASWLFGGIAEDVMTGDPLTVTDQHSRFILGCEGMAAISGDESREVFEELFRRYGVPESMRSDNGTPFSSTGLGNLSKLSVYWMLLGIRLDSGVYEGWRVPLEYDPLLSKLAVSAATRS